MTKQYTIGIDVGGSHISCTAMDMNAKELVTSSFTREKLSHISDAQTIFQAWAKAINECMQSVGVENVIGLGFAIPGPFNYKDGVSLMEHKYPNLFNLHIPTELKKYLVNPSVEMRFLNDATAFAVGVSWIGKGKGFDNVVVITLGTGFGSAYIRKGIPVVEGAEVAPEGCFWHLPFKNGIADDYFSTRWFTNEYEKRMQTPIKGVKEIIETPISEELFNEFGTNLGEFSAPWLKKFSTDILVMGGNISLAYEHFEKAFVQKLKEENCDVKIAVSELMENAAMVGASRLFEASFWKEISEHLPKI